MKNTAEALKNHQLAEKQNWIFFRRSCHHSFTDLYGAREVRVEVNMDKDRCAATSNLEKQPSSHIHQLRLDVDLIGTSILDEFRPHKR